MVYCMFHSFFLSLSKATGETRAPRSIVILVTEQFIHVCMKETGFCEASGDAAAFNGPRGGREGWRERGRGRGRGNKTPILCISAPWTANVLNVASILVTVQRKRPDCVVSTVFSFAESNKKTII